MSCLHLSTQHRAARRGESQAGKLKYPEAASLPSIGNRAHINTGFEDLEKKAKTINLLAIRPHDGHERGNHPASAAMTVSFIPTASAFGEKQHVC